MAEASPCRRRWRGPTLFAQPSRSRVGSFCEIALRVLNSHDYSRGGQTSPCQPERVLGMAVTEANAAGVLRVAYCVRGAAEIVEYSGHSWYTGSRSHGQSWKISRRRGPASSFQSDAREVAKSNL
jgi:hypothetical protein